MPPHRLAALFRPALGGADIFDRILPMLLATPVVGGGAIEIVRSEPTECTDCANEGANEGAGEGSLTRTPLLSEVVQGCRLLPAANDDVDWAAAGNMRTWPSTGDVGLDASPPSSGPVLALPNSDDVLAVAAAIEDGILRIFLATRFSGEGALVVEFCSSGADVTDTRGAVVAAADVGALPLALASAIDSVDDLVDDCDENPSSKSARLRFRPGTMGCRRRN